ncbi:integrase, catalytic region, zinc finger, CCHC-type containing protein [Tanacetum coccineum]
MSENKDKYHDTIIDLEARAKKNEDVVLKMGNSLQGMFMLGPKPMSFYDSKVKHGLGYTNPYTLKKAISQNPKLYDASCLDDSKIQMNVRDTEDILDDATKSQNKMKKKSQDPIVIEKKQNVWTINYNKLNSLYKDFVPQKELSTKQKYFSSSFIYSENSSNTSSPYSSFEAKPTMPSANPMLVDLNKMENVFKTLFKLLQMNSKRESIFYTSLEEIRLTNFCRQEVKPILYELHLNFEIFQKRFLRDINEMKDFFDSTKNDLCETSKQNELLKEQLLEAKIKHEIECYVLLRHECVDNREINELIENVNQKTYAYAVVRGQNQDLLITISELKAKLKNAKKGKSVNTKFGKDTVSHNLLCVTPRPSHRDLSFKNNVLSNNKNSSEKVKVSDRTYKKSDVAPKNVDSNKKIVTNDDIKNALIVKNVLCLSCAKNMLIPCHDNCLAKYKLNVHSKVKRALFTTSRTVKSEFKDPTLVVLKTKFSVKNVQSKSIDTALVVSKTKIAAVTLLSAKHKEYYVEGLGHNLFSVGQFCDGDLEVAFRSKLCYVQNLEGDDMLTGDRESNLYTISISIMAASSPVCLMSKSTSTKSWLWHRRLSHLNFGPINDLTKHDLVNGLPKFKYGKDHLCSACER